MNGISVVLCFVTICARRRDVLKVTSDRVVHGKHVSLIYLFLVIDSNDGRSRINLVSRRDCRVEKAPQENYFSHFFDSWPTTMLPCECQICQITEGR